MFTKRSEKLERIDTGDYTPEEYDRFLKEIRFINRYVGDRRALKRSLLKQLSGFKQKSLSVLDVGAGSGELLRTIAEAAADENINLRLIGLELNKQSADSILKESTKYRQIKGIQGDALELPFKDNSFDFTISSLFTHHLTNSQIVRVLQEMDRVTTTKIYVIDLHRHPAGYAAYRAFCKAFFISELVTHDGSLSVLKGFKPAELVGFAEKAGLRNINVSRSFPFRLVLSSGADV